MGSTEEAFCLKWNDFQKSVTSSFAELRRDSDLTDITIVVEGTHLKAHKVILSACSGAFKDLFRSGISKDPIVMLWDVSAEDMEALFNFMYQGQVNVVQERLNTFLDLAERLRVKGLTNKSAEDEEDEEIHKSPRRPTSSVHSRSNTPNTTTNTSTSNDHNRKRLTGNSPSSNSSNKKQRVKDESDSEDKSVDKTHPIVMIKQESGKISTGGTDGDDRNDGINEMDDSSYGGEYNNDYFDTEGEQFTEDMIQGTSHDFTSAESNKGTASTSQGICPWCNKSFVKLNRHIEDIHFPVPTKCDVCHKEFASRHKMQNHRHTAHKSRPNITSTNTTVSSSPESFCPYCQRGFDSKHKMHGHIGRCSQRPSRINLQSSWNLP
uniref:BroadZ1like [Tribolium castaneum] n=1 Tax=Lepeophtheirus salmonis TaxID=72036 RepID=A0A0K2UN98_LEPSM